MQMRRILIGGILGVWLQGAQAEVAQMQIPADLVFRSEQMEELLGLLATDMSAQPQWVWSEMKSQLPFKTIWRDLRARGPFQLKVLSQNFVQHELGFEMSWATPQLEVGEFEIQDVIVRVLGAIRLRVHVVGKCQGLKLELAPGMWKVRGQIKWNLTAAGVQLDWNSLQMEAPVEGGSPKVDLGTCTGPLGVQQAVREALIESLSQVSWMESMLKTGLRQVMQEAMVNLHHELMQERHLTVADDLDLSWKPDGLLGMPNGALRLGGQVTLTVKNSPKEFTRKTVKTLQEEYLDSVTESAVILPKDTLPDLLQFLYESGVLRTRLKSWEIPAFQTLMQSRFFQFFLWPDLMSFAKTTRFYFDLTLQTSPQLANGQTTNSTVRYNLTTNISSFQWAPNGGQYVRYLDLTSPLRGPIQFAIDHGQIRVGMVSSELDLHARFHPDFRALRSVNTRLATETIGSHVGDALKDMKFQYALPQWNVSQDMALMPVGLQLRKQSLRVPLQFRKNK